MCALPAANDQLVPQFPKPRAQVRFLPGALPLAEPKPAEVPANWRNPRIDASRRLATLHDGFSPYRQGLRRGAGAKQGQIGPMQVRFSRHCSASVNSPGWKAWNAFQRGIPGCC